MEAWTKVEAVRMDGRGRSEGFGARAGLGDRSDTGGIDEGWFPLFD